MAFETVKSQRKEKRKIMISAKRFSFPNFSNFWKFRNRFWYQIEKMFLINYQYFWSYATFLLKFWHTVKHAVTMPSHHGYCLTCMYGCLKFYCPKMRGSWVIGAQKTILLEKIMMLFGKRLWLIRINKTLMT